jgi:hypothetical protein
VDLISSSRIERTVDRDYTVSFHNLILQIEPAERRGTMAGCRAIGFSKSTGRTCSINLSNHRVC